MDAEAEGHRHLTVHPSNIRVLLPYCLARCSLEKSWAVNLPVRSRSNSLFSAPTMGPQIPEVPIRLPSATSPLQQAFWTNALLLPMHCDFRPPAPKPIVIPISQKRQPTSKPVQAQVSAGPRRHRFYLRALQTNSTASLYIHLLLMFTLERICLAAACSKALYLFNQHRPLH